MKFKIAVLAAATVMAWAWTASATLVSYSVGDSGSTSYPGPVTPPAGAPHSVDGWGYPGDTVTLQAGSGSLNLADGSTGTMNIGTLGWGVAYTYGGTATSWAQADWADLKFTINALRSITIGTATGTISQGGTLESTWDDDYLSLSAEPVASVLVQDGVQWYRVDITPNSLPVADVVNFDGTVAPPAGGFSQPDRDMTATFTVTAVEVPEPTTVIAGALLLLPFGASTLRIMRSKQVA